MECKLLLFSFLCFYNSELIDTLWNVNIELKEGTAFCQGELIDTLWNVNKINGYVQ